MIYLYNPINNIKTATDYELLSGITGKTVGNLASLKCKKRSIENIKCYIVDDDTTVPELKKMMQDVKIKDEIWKVIESASSYEISSYGRVRKTWKHKQTILMPSIHHNNRKKGHSRRCLYIKIQYDDGKRRPQFIHQLVARHFLENEDNLPYIYHKNENIFDNYVGNLTYISKEDIGKLTAYKSNSIPVLKLDAKTGEILDEYRSMAEAGRANYTHKENIRQCIKGLQKTAAGFKWAIDDGTQYDEEDVV